MGLHWLFALAASAALLRRRSTEVDALDDDLPPAPAPRGNTDD
jgi:hypothetical protein